MDRRWLFAVEVEENVKAGKNGEDWLASQSLIGREAVAFFAFLLFSI